MLFGQVYGDPDALEPLPIEFNMYRKRIEVFVGDRWHVLGDFHIKSHGIVAEIDMLDVDDAIARHAALDDGFAEWVEWGPLLN